jgi:putative transposase
MKSRKHYSAYQKIQIVLELLKEEKTVSHIASEYRDHPNQLHRWKRQAMGSFPKLFEDSRRNRKVKQAECERRMNELYEEIGRLTTQLNWLKKIWY